MCISWRGHKWGPYGDPFVTEVTDSNGKNSHTTTLQRTTCERCNAIRSRTVPVILGDI